ncbi:MAG: hypothetical protein AAGA63_08405 [Pseudomonadota bacterium]
MTLAPGRAHEFCGPARRTLALMLAAQMEGPIFWVQSAWEGDRLHGLGLAPYVDPGRITFVRPERFMDLLWCTEEILRAGCVPLVVTELPTAPSLTPVRRLHLAAEAGAKVGRPPISVLLTPEDGGAQSVESRWRLEATHQQDRAEWRLTCLRARMSRPAPFQIAWGDNQAVLVPLPAPA